MTASTLVKKGWMSKLASLVLSATLLAVLTLLPCHPLDAQQEAPLQIQKRFLRSALFVYRGEEPQPVTGFLSFSEAFTDLLGKHPAALEQANKAKVYHATALIGSVGMLGVSVKMLIETLDDAKDVSSGTISSNTGTTSWTDVGLLAGFGAVMVVSGLKANSHLNNAVRIFNEQDTSLDGSRWQPRLKVGLQPTAGGRALALGVSFKR